ncbi:MAG: 2-succinyl-6-hydroxy-2,4-cyclohexadiene-1-carboxylate synthase [Pasteurellales bacterium]|nr:MAG: 2-succinyl-6-hydroxy-2,4-cyclohexadiene-1-carboxylate synthase [Pasteurellales bacterium]
MLAFKWHQSLEDEASIPVVFLHGLLGSQDDWDWVIKKLPKTSNIIPLTIDLPSHGESKMISCNNFNDVCQQIHYRLSQIKQPFWLVGYSLGGRISLYYRLFFENPYLYGVIVEGANIGLSYERQRQQRWENDNRWAIRFENEDIENVLQDWYQQAVFSDLDFSQKQDLINKRKNNEGIKIAQMLRATSLSKQPFLLDKIKKLVNLNIYFFIGERDKKFRYQAQVCGLNYQIIKGAGHNSHWENPQEFANKLQRIINE